MSHSFNFQGKHVVVAGGSSGINLGIAKAFAQNGAKLFIFSRSQDKVDAAVEFLKEDAENVVGATADVRDPEQVIQVLKQANEVFGNIDVLVSGAAGNFPASAIGMSSNGFKSVVDIDLIGTFNVMRHAYEFLTKPGASIISISAPQAFTPAEMQVHVCAAKAGVDMITRCLAMEWGAAGIRINSIAPGPIEETEGMKRLAPNEAVKKAVQKSVPLDRFGEKQDVANLALFLASPLSSYITGTVIPVDGGWTLQGFGHYMELMKQAMAS